MWKCFGCSPRGCTAVHPKRVLSVCAIASHVNLVFIARSLRQAKLRRSRRRRRRNPSDWAGQKWASGHLTGSPFLAHTRMYTVKRRMASAWRAPEFIMRFITCVCVCLFLIYRHQQKVALAVHFPGRRERRVNLLPRRIINSGCEFHPAPRVKKKADRERHSRVCQI